MEPIQTFLLCAVEPGAVASAKAAKVANTDELFWSGLSVIQTTTDYHVLYSDFMKHRVLYSDFMKHRVLYSDLKGYQVIYSDLKKKDLIYHELLKNRI